tara:strand:- start:304 stop:1554 length:1251 start_codon:yes stop_codon:yes gene_type:complete
MKPLNRPMFRYGGPIKEGVMSGIREPRQGYNLGARVIGSVKNFFNKPTAPVNSGIVATNAANKGGFIPAMATKVKEIFRGREIPTSVAAGGTGKTTGAIVPYGSTVSTGSIRGNIPFGKNPFDNQSILAATQRVLTPATDAVIGTAKAVKPYTGVLTIGGVTYSMLKPDGRKKTIEELSEETGTDTTTITKEIESNEPKIDPEKNRKDRIQKYRDIMDIKGMNKTAAYNSLIAASQLINQEGDFKGSIKDGSLINKIIGAANTQFQKPRATKDAIDTLILKGEIQSDIAAGKPSAIEQQINAVSKNLKVDKTTATKMVLKQPVDVRSQITEDMAVTKSAVPTFNLVVSGTKKQYPNAIVMATDKQVKEEYGDNVSAAKIIESSDAFKKAKDPSGVYIVGTEVVQVDKQGNINTIFP